MRNLLLFLATTALAGCTTTSIISSENPSKNRPPQWLDYWTLPVHVYGATPRLSQAQLEALYKDDAQPRRVELFVNAANLPPIAGLCSDPGAFTPARQQGAYATLTGALCNGSSVVTYATADILTGGLSPDQVRGHLEMMHLQLWQALTYGNNHPEQAHPSWMYGP